MRKAKQDLSKTIYYSPGDSHSIFKVINRMPFNNKINYIIIYIHDMITNVFHKSHLSLAFLKLSKWCFIQSSFILEISSVYELCPVLHEAFSSWCSVYNNCCNNHFPTFNNFSSKLFFWVELINFCFKLILS